MPTFTVTAENRAWIPTAPVVLTNQVAVNAPPEQVFNRLADIGAWADWCVGMNKVRIDSPAATGVGALRTVWVGRSRVQERFLEWVPAERLTFAIVSSNTPGLASMVEDWAVAPDPADRTRTILTVTIGVAPSGLLRHAPKPVGAIMSRLTKKGQDAIVTQFPEAP
jgi:uncharacterized protein YndB with AHSA1/START domain